MLNRRFRSFHRYLVDCFLLQSVLLLFIGVISLQYLPVGGAIADGLFAFFGFLICLSQFWSAHRKFLQLFLSENDGGKEVDILPPCIGG